MRNRLIAVALILVAGAAVYLFVQNMKLQKELNAEKAKADNVAPVVIQPTKPANPPDESPFDKPNNDPQASSFKPNATGPDKITSIKFDKMEYNFGKINEGDKVDTKFKFTNTGEWALVIAGAQSSCGCTVPEWPKTPIKPGDEGEIDVSFDSHGKHGEIKKTIIVVSNTKPQINNLYIYATVIPRDR